MAVNDIYRLRVYWRFGDQVSINTIHLRTLTETGVINRDELAQYLLDDCETAWGALVTSAATYLGISLQRIAPVALDPVVKEAVGVSGQVLGEPLPRQVCGLISWRTGEAGRSNRGRMYVPFPSETDNLTGEGPTPNYTARMQNLADFFIGGVPHSGSGGLWTINLIPIIWGPTKGLGLEINGAAIRTGWATQRRRGTYGRQNPPHVS